MFVTPQNLIEFWSVATRPRDANGLGMAGTAAMTLITRIKRFFPVLRERKYTRNGNDWSCNTKF